MSKDFYFILFSVLLIHPQKASTSSPGYQEWMSRQLLTNKKFDIEGGECSVKYSFNAKGDNENDFLIAAFVDSPHGCCELLHHNHYYNIFVFCPRRNNCFNTLNPNDQIAYRACYLKYSDTVANGNEPNFYTSGAGIDFISGYIPFRSREDTTDCLQPTSVQCDVQALLEIKSKLDSQGQAFYASWKGDNPCDGSWLHVECADVGRGSYRVVGLAFSLFSWTPTFNDKYVSESDRNKARTQFGQLLPITLTKMRYLVELELGQASFSGSIFPEISVLEKLEVLDIKENSGITGSIPPEISSLKNLGIFDISTNTRLTGGLPEELSELSKMQFFRTSRNRDLQGSLPTSYSTWKDVYHFELWESGLTGTLPVQYSTWQKTEQFQLNGNAISGSLPGAFSEWSVVLSFTVPVNQLSGTLPPQYSVFNSVQLMWFNNNNLSGTLPSEYSVFTGLLVGNQAGSLCVTDPSIFTSEDVASLPFC